jgi:hypothetical protein
MEKETWPHADVRAWLGQHALAIQVDVDEERELAKRFEVEAMPTVVALKDGQEFDRIVGFRDAAGLLAWCKDVLAGKRTTDELAERAQTLAESTNVHERYELAKDLFRAKKYDEALRHYLWLWPASRDAIGMGGVRLSFMLGDMARLADKHEPAKKAFLALLDELQAEVDAVPVPEFRVWMEWRALCRDFGGSSRLIAWYEKKRDEQGRLPLADQTPQLLQELIVRDVFETLMSAQRARDAVRLYPDARKRGAEIVTQYEQMQSAGGLLDEESRQQIRSFQRRKLTGDLAQLFAALLAAERTAEALDVAGMLLGELDEPEARLALVRAGLLAELQQRTATKTTDG